MILSPRNSSAQASLGIVSSCVLKRKISKQPPWYILLYNFLVIHPHFMKFDDFS